MKTYVCKTCNLVVEIEANKKRRMYCPPCAKVKGREHDVASAARLKRASQSAAGAPNKAERSRQFALRMAAIAPYTRVETAKMLGVSDEQIRQDEISIIMKIRKHCSGLAAECGYKVA